MTVSLHISPKDKRDRFPALGHVGKQILIQELQRLVVSHSSISTLGNDVTKGRMRKWS